jgi:uncharacterized protein (DUF1697 family)
MPITIALLRGINVGGKRMKMADLRYLFDDMGFSDAKTMLQTGNVVFETDVSDHQELVTRIEASIQEEFGFESKIIIRSQAELIHIFENSPFTAQQLTEPSKSAVIFLGGTPDAAAIDDLMQAHDGPETVTVRGQEVFAFYPEGMGRSTLDHKLIEKSLKVNGTARNWNTVTKLIALADEFGA